MKVVLTSGGTGGHIFPAEALARELVERGADITVMTDHRFSQYAGNLSAFPTHILPCSTLSGGVFAKLKGAWSIVAGYRKARQLLKEIKPDVVVGFGGYPSFPAMLAATHLKLKTVIHEQNSVLGRTNNVMASKVDAIALSYPNTLRVNDNVKPKTHVVGNPVRNAVCEVGKTDYDAYDKGKTFHLLVMGGSQGASVFSEIVPKALGKLPLLLRQNMHVSHQCRPADVDQTRVDYAQYTILADIDTFFSDVPERLKRAQLVITRSGASTVAELAVSGRPSILVPYPHATDDHQRINAQSLEDAGAAWVMPQDGFTVDALAAKMEAFFTLPSTLAEAAENAKNIGNPDAAKTLADVVGKLAGQNGHLERNAA